LTTGAANEFSRITHMMKPVDNTSIAHPNACSPRGTVDAWYRRSSPIARNQIRATTPNASMNFLSAAG